MNKTQIAILKLLAGKTEAVKFSQIYAETHEEYRAVDRGLQALRKLAAIDQSDGKGRWKITDFGRILLAQAGES